MATNTTNYDLIKPAVNDPADQDLWGGYLNENFDTLDGLIKTASDTTVSDKTGAYTVTTSDRNGLISCDATSGAFNISFPTAASVENGFKVSVKKVDVSTNAVTLDANGSETIDGATTYVLAEQYDFVTIVSDGTEWLIVANKAEITFADNTSSNTGTATDEALTPANFGTQNDLSTDGYQKLPAGVIMQWGEVTNTVGTTTVTFPIEFPNAVFFVSNTPIDPRSPTNEFYVGGATNWTTTGFSSFVHVNGDNNPVGQYWATDTKYFAIGH